MALNLAPYRRALAAARLSLARHLANGRSSVAEIATARRAVDIMAREIAQSPQSLAIYERMAEGGSGPERWALAVLRRARDELYPHLASDAAARAYRDKRMEYLQLGEAIVRSPDMRYRCVIDRHNGRSYLYRENPLMPRVMRVIADELMRWFDAYPVDREFYQRGWYLTWPARQGLALFLEERPDVVALLRAAQTLPLDSEIRDIPIDRPALVQAVELVICLIPVVGNLVAAYEAYSGVDLFGYRLTDLERGILAASVLLPLAGRLARGGRALYTEARLVALYGRDAAQWSRVVRASSVDRAALRSIEEAEAQIRLGRPVAQALRRRAAQALPVVVRGGAASSAVDQAIRDLLAQLSSRYPVLASLDDIALYRVLAKGPNVDHLKGRLLEELIEARIVPWLRDRAGSYALGVSSRGRTLEFIPGHVIRDAAGLEITDGILAWRNHGVLEIVAIFEAKAGRSSSRELSYAGGSLSALSRDDRIELRAVAREAWQEQREVAAAAGRPFNRTVEQVERDIVLSERGGQVRRDVERLSENADGTLARIRVGGTEMPVRISPTTTKFFGVLPRDVRAATLERQLREGGFSYEIIGADITQQQLRQAAAQMQPLARQLAGGP